MSKFDRWTEAMLANEEPEQDIVDELKRRQAEMDEARVLSNSTRYSDGKLKIIDTKSAGLDMI